jgi:hypothetical protein
MMHMLTGYFYLRNRSGMLVEAHSWKDYATRVRITRNVIASVVSQVAAHGGDWLALAQQADARAVQLAAKQVPQSLKASERTRIVASRGYARRRKLMDDPKFAVNPAARLEFFYRRHPSWDERLNLYPVMRTAAVPT